MATKKLTNRTVVKLNQVIPISNSLHWVEGRGEGSHLLYDGEKDSGFLVFSSKVVFWGRNTVFIPKSWVIAYKQKTWLGYSSMAKAMKVCERLASLPHAIPEYGGC